MDAGVVEEEGDGPYHNSIIESEYAILAFYTLSFVVNEDAS